MSKQTIHKMRGFAFSVIDDTLQEIVTEPIQEGEPGYEEGMNIERPKVDASGATVMLTKPVKQLVFQEMLDAPGGMASPGDQFFWQLEPQDCVNIAVGLMTGLPGEARAELTQRLGLVIPAPATALGQLR